MSLCRYVVMSHVLKYIRTVRAARGFGFPFHFTVIIKFQEVLINRIITDGLWYFYNCYLLFKSEIIIIHLRD